MVDCNYCTKSDKVIKMKVESSKNLKRYNHLIGELDAAYHEASLKLGVSDSITKILYTICNCGTSCPLNEISKQTGLSRQTVNSAIRNLESDGIIYLKNVNAKAKEVCLTEKGLAAAKNTAMKIIAMENDILASWTEDEVQNYLNMTERFLADLKERVKQL